MAALCNKAGHYIFVLSFLLSSSRPIFYLLLFSSPILSRRILDVYHTSIQWCGLSANLGCRSETWCTRLAENKGRKKSPKIRHLRTIAQLCRAISSQLRHYRQSVKIVKQQYLLRIFLQYGELRPSSG